VEEGYKTVTLPFKKIHAPAFYMTAEWNLQQLLGYLSTWSASKKYQHTTGTNPVDKIRDKLCGTWGLPSTTRLITWPLSLKIWQKGVAFPHST